MDGGLSLCRQDRVWSQVRTSWNNRQKQRRNPLAKAFVRNATWIIQKMLDSVHDVVMVSNELFFDFV